MAQCQEPRAHIILFFGLYLYLAGKYCKNPKVPGAQLNVNPTRECKSDSGNNMVWRRITIYCTFFNYNSPPPRQFLCNKIVLKKISYSKGMLMEQIFKLRGPGLPGRTSNPITGCFYDKTITSKENVRLDRYLVLKYYRRQCTSPYLGQIT